MWRTQPSMLHLGQGGLAADTAPSGASQAVWGTAWQYWRRRIARTAILLTTDLTALLLAATLGYVLWARAILHQPLVFYVEFVALLGLFPLGYAGAGLYPGFGIGAVETLRRLSCCTSFAFLVLAAASFVMKMPSYHSRITYVIAWGASLALVPFLRFLVLSVVNHWGWWREPAVLVGRGEQLQKIMQTLRNAFSLGYQPVGVLLSSMPQRGRTEEGVPVLGPLEWAPRIAERGVEVVLIGEEDLESASVSWLQQHFRRVIMIQHPRDLPVERVHVRNLGGVLSVEFTNNLLVWRNRILKRVLDVSLGSVLLLLAFPLIILGGLAVQCCSRGPLFFCQEREGLNGCRIKIWKLRTMYVDAEQRLEEFLELNPELRREWQAHCKLAHDPRVIPRVGELLRRWSIDELPQLWSVVKGEMSLVGPRPFPEYHLQQFSLAFRELRRRVRPGLTGMWQVTVRSNSSFEEQQAYDTYYIRNWSVWIDLHILARTVHAVLAGRGAY